MAPSFQTPPPESASFILSYPSQYIVLVTINREKGMNSIAMATHWEAHEIFTWFDKEPSLRVAIITGAGQKAFCAGQDLVEQAKIRASGSLDSAVFTKRLPPTGFAGVSKRVGRKPIIAAVNGFALGGGFEICLNCDIIIASPTASFGLPEATVGLYAAAGGLPRLVHNAGLQIASELALTGRRLSAKEALDFQLINKISKSQSTVVDESVEMAEKIADLSPDAVIVTRAGLREAWATGNVEKAAQKTADEYDKLLFGGENIKIGTEAFAKKQKPNWLPSKI